MRLDDSRHIRGVGKKCRPTDEANETFHLTGSRQLSEPSPREAPHKRHVEIPASKHFLKNPASRSRKVTSSSVGATSIAASINALDAVLWISSSWNKVQPEAIRKCFRRAGFVRDQEDDVELRPDNPTREAEIEGVDFEDFVAMDDEVATSTEPDPQAIIQSILAEAGMSVEASSAGDDAEEESDDETEMVQKLKEEDVRRMLAQLRCFAAEKCPEMLSGVASAEAALTAYVCSKNKHQTRIDTIFRKHSSPCKKPYA
ncbi:hypothetical protein M514_23584 [Trichuris suis]|uniref:DDE-1 domain-containing protein n=1 Tax=Trichuris suis TaxID=68888 RepID=A0A085N4A4_9BILA|nr:hypothetical protein M514_23584 [Trichuris suis]